MSHLHEHGTLWEFFVHVAQAMALLNLPQSCRPNKRAVRPGDSTLARRFSSGLSFARRSCSLTGLEKYYQRDCSKQLTSGVAPLLEKLLHCVAKAFFRLARSCLKLKMFAECFAVAKTYRGAVQAVLGR